MKPSRREFVALALGAGASVALLGATQSWRRSSKASPMPTYDGSDGDYRLLSRITYGPRPDDMLHLRKIGRVAFIDEQLHPDSLSEDWQLTFQLRRLGDCLTTDMGELMDQDDRRLAQALRQAAILRACYSNRQLLERTVEFWSDHFNIFFFKGDLAPLKVVDDVQTIRGHAFGRFRDLLGASARSAAMMHYLNNDVNRVGVPNENYAREIMELHTLGVDGGYTQNDVREVARCFTGWTYERHWHVGRFRFDPSAHDNGAKSVLGYVIPANGGISDGNRVLDILAAHQSTARHLATKLAVAFIGESQPQTVDLLAAVFARTNGNIREVLRALLNGNDVLNGPPILKRPFDYVASAVRAYEVQTDGGTGIQSDLERMGQPLFGWPEPDGYSRKTSTWMGDLIPRWNFAIKLASNQLGGTRMEPSRFASVDELIGRAVGPSGINDTSLAEVCAMIDRRDAPAAILMSPAFMWR